MSSLKNCQKSCLIFPKLKHKISDPLNSTPRLPLTMQSSSFSIRRISDRHRSLLILLGSLIICTAIYMWWTEFTFSTALLSVKGTCFGKTSTYVHDSVKASEEIYQASIRKREVLVKGKPEKIDPWKPHKYPYDYFLATFACPFSSQRIGILGDGGKWVCGMEFLEKKQPCVVYSFGISGEISFEQEILERTSCKLYGYDASVNRIPVSKEHSNRVTFYKLWGGDEVSNTTTTIGGAMRNNGHTRIDLLKVDIEGSEFKMLKQVIEEFGDELPFSQLLLEIHMSDFASLYHFFVMLENAGLRPVRNELNISPFIMGYSRSALSEYSFLNIKNLC